MNRYRLRMEQQFSSGESYAEHTIGQGFSEHDYSSSQLQTAVRTYLGKFGPYAMGMVQHCAVGSRAGKWMKLLKVKFSDTEVCKYLCTFWSFNLKFLLK